MYRRIVKRVFDILLCVLFFPFFLILSFFIAVAIKVDDRGPIFYIAPRLGKNCKIFYMYKFRSMKQNAPDLKMDDGSTYNAPDDPRVTRVGAFLRRTSLDEIPQVINVLKGDMSFIGPRPDLQEEGDLYTGDNGRKLEVLPGITGYAQVYGRNAIPWKERLDLDVYYVDNQSFCMDLKIFFRTIAVVFKQEGVYVDSSAEP